MPSTPEDDEGEEAFQEIPTVANRALPGAEVGAADADPSATSGEREGAGTYRLVRPTVSDFVDQPVVAKIDPNASKGVVIGAARKPR